MKVERKGESSREEKGKKIEMKRKVWEKEWKGGRKRKSRINVVKRKENENVGRRMERRKKERKRRGVEKRKTKRLRRGQEQYVKKREREGGRETIE